MPVPFNAGRFACALDSPPHDLSSLPLAARLALLDTAPAGSPFSLYGAVWQSSALHLRPSELAPYRSQGVPLADAALLSLRSLGSQACPVSSHSLQAAAAAGDAACSALLASASCAPAWVCWERIHHGSSVFTDNLPLFGVCLLNLSLLGGYGSPMINEVLRSSGGLVSSSAPGCPYSSSGSSARRRIMETLQFVSDTCCGGQGALQPGGRGWRSALCVRLLHSRVRAKLHPTSTSTPAEVPINASDLLATSLSFSLVPLLGLERTGLAAHLCTQDMADVLHLWRYIGHLLGVPSELCVPPAAQSGAEAELRHAQAQLESLVSASFLFSPEQGQGGQAGLTQAALLTATLAAVSWQPPMPWWGPRQHAAITAALAGQQYAAALGVLHCADRLQALHPLPPSRRASGSWQLPLWAPAALLACCLGAAAAGVQLPGGLPARAALYAGGAAAGAVAALQLLRWLCAPPALAASMEGVEGEGSRLLAPLRAWQLLQRCCPFPVRAGLRALQRRGLGALLRVELGSPDSVAFRHVV